MKKRIFIALVIVLFISTSCGNADQNGSGKKQSPIDSANNGIVPPSSSPGDANNSSLADTSYPAKDSAKQHRDSVK